MSGRLWIAIVAAAGLQAATQIPAGTQIQIRLTTAVKSTSAKVGDPVEAVVVAPVVAKGRIVMAAGATLKGHVAEAVSAVKPDDQAVLDLDFDHVSDSTGAKAMLAAKVASIDNARESVDSHGRILGIVASQTGAGRLDEGINKIAEKYQGLAGLLNTVKGAVLKEPDANIDFEPGVDMALELTKAVDWSGSARGPNVAAIEPQDELYRLVNAQPARTMAEKPAKPSDMTNLMFLGSLEQIEKAFEKAGWHRADALNAQSKFQTFQAMAEQRGYSEAPVSILLLDGRAPDVAMEKETDTFSARHHARIWHRPRQFQGQDVWVCSATHDTGIDFSETARNFTHKVDVEIDHERAKVVNDLLFTGLVRGLSLVDRPDAPTAFSNATGDNLRTDGAMAVIRF
ncbi:MAG TPA: LssY C-terminal domain-containing protein [Bryobacteraceae bacterium]|nr:LssY C-terminal domain-containing protein [Bryobacteraceae bacterium]